MLFVRSGFIEVRHVRTIINLNMHILKDEESLRLKPMQYTANFPQGGTLIFS